MGTNSSSAYPLLDQLAEEFAARYRRGERPSLKEYTDKYPQLAEEICELFPALVEMERVDEDRQESEQQAQVDPSPPLRQVGDYSILREIGHGGMGVVYEAEQQSLGRRVALKILSLHAAPNAKTLARFHREAKAAARLHHTNIVPVFEVGQKGATCYYAMQLIQGQSLEQIIEELRGLRLASVETTAHNAPAESLGEPPHRRTGSPALSQVAQSLLTGHFEPRPLASASPLPDQPAVAVLDEAPTEAAVSSTPIRSMSAPSESLSATQVAMLPGRAEFTSATASHRHYFRSLAQLGRQAAAALAYAHSRGIIHRDIKPSNLLLDLSGVVWITDFGLAKSEDDGLTITGEMPGTLRYMSPERFRGECDARADVYGLGLTLYEMLVLKPAFEARDRMQLIEQIGHEEPARPRSVDAQVPLDLETIVLKAIDKEPRRRYQSAEEMAEDLRRFTSDEPIRARRASLSERVARWCRRNPTVAGLMAAVTATLFLGTVVATFFAVKADAKAREAWANEKQAKEEKREADLARDRAITALSVSAWLADEVEDRFHAFADNDRWDEALAVVKDVRLRQPNNAAAVLVSARLFRRYADSLRKQGQNDMAARMDLESREFYEKLRSLQPDHSGYAGEFGTFLLSRLEPTGTAAWEVLEPITMASAGGTTLTKQPDGSILASGKNPLPETYTITAKTRLTGITAIRLEVLPDPSLPSKGPGRALNGNFHLDEFQVTAASQARPGTTRPVRFRDAWADYFEYRTSWDQWPVMMAIDGNPNTGWSVHPEAGKPHVAVFELMEPLATTSGIVLTIRLEQQHNYSGWVHNLGRFRLSVTTAGEESLLRARWRTIIQRRKPIDGWTMLGAALYLRGEWRDALNVLLKATTAPSGGNGWEHLLLMQIYAAHGQPNQAERWRGELLAWLAENEADEQLWQFAYASLSAGNAEGVADSLVSRLAPTRPDVWEVLDPVEMSSAGGTTLTKQQDGSILASGKNPFPETYTITAKTRLTDITAVRLELLPDLSLPRHGPGRASNGNCHLTRFRIKATPEDNPNKATPLVLHNAWADFSQTGFPVEAVLGGAPNNSWAVVPETGRPHVALFQLEEPLTSANRMVLTFALEQGVRNSATVCNIGRFRLSVTALPRTIEAEKLRRGLDRHDIWIKLAMAYYQRGEKEAALTVMRKALADYDKAVKLKPGEAKLVALRAELAARCGKYAAAADDFGVLAHKEAADAHFPFRFWYRHALALLAAGKKEEYQRSCTRMIERFKDTKSTLDAFFTAWTVALSPDAVADFGPVLPLAQKAVDGDAQYPQTHQGVGAVLYRMGRLEECLEHLDSAQAVDNSRNQTSPAYRDYFRAMAHHRLGHKEEARECFQRAVAQTDKELRDDEQTSHLENWVRKVTLKLLRAEAEAVLRGAAAGQEK